MSFSKKSEESLPHALVFMTIFFADNDARRICRIWYVLISFKIESGLFANMVFCKSWVRVPAVSFVIL